MMQAGAIVGLIDRSVVAKSMAPGAARSNTVPDLNVPYEGPKEYETPTVDLIFPLSNRMLRFSYFVSGYPCDCA
ncbi:hypothetical protein L1987_11974 [Smallanthus sonchifolius]|uniref:Uncharacterized protein n=1 Tax=Smallanthus sonchifolius TaxID=185202 RepID=A0ACB9JEL5_9ASTR|nr:hypothetical protein L1987_11974 [Smallanthus sonchifolius]